MPKPQPDKPTDKPMELVTLIDEVKRQLAAPLTSPAMFEVESIDIEVSVMTEVRGDGGINIWVFNASIGGSKDHTQTIRLQLKPIKTIPRFEERKKK